MSGPRSGGTRKPDQKQRESAAVRARTDAASEQETEKTNTTEPVEGEATAAGDVSAAVKTPETDAFDSATFDGAADEAAEDGEPARAKRRLGSWVRRRRRGRVDSDRSDSVSSDAAEAGDHPESAEPIKARRRISWSRVLAFGMLPGLALLLAAAGGFLKWQDSSVRASQTARIESIAAAKDSTIALLSYKPDTVEKDLNAAKSRLTGTFKDSYSHLIDDVVIPGAKRAHVSTTATVPAAASVSATPNHAVVLLFVNQTAVVDKDPPSDTASSVRVTLDKVSGRWLIAGFDPV